MIGSLTSMDKIRYSFCYLLSLLLVYNILNWHYLLTFNEESDNLIIICPFLLSIPYSKYLSIYYPAQ